MTNTQSAAVVEVTPIPQVVPQETEALPSAILVVVVHQKMDWQAMPVGLMANAPFASNGALVQQMGVVVHLLKAWEHQKKVLTENPSVS
jgi:hypothetical protein